MNASRRNRHRCAGAALSALSVAACMVILTGCAWAERNFTRRNTSTPLTPDAAAALLADNGLLTPVTLSARGRVEVVRSQWRGGGDISALVQTPDHFYFEFNGPLGAMAIVACNGRQLRVWDVRNRVMAISPATEQLSILADLPISAEAFVRLLTVRPPDPRHDASFSKRIAGFILSDGSRQVIVRGDDGLLHVILFDANGRPKSYGVVSGRNLLAMATYLGDPAHALMPYRRATLQIPGRNEHLEVTWEVGSLRDDIEAPDSAFAPEPPPFVRIQHGVIRLEPPGGAAPQDR